MKPYIFDNGLTFDDINSATGGLGGLDFGNPSKTGLGLLFSRLRRPNTLRTNLAGVEKLGITNYTPPGTLDMLLENFEIPKRGVDWSIEDWL